MRMATACFLAVIATGSAVGDSPSPPLLPSGVQEALDRNAAILSNILITGERSRRFVAPADTALKTLQTLEPEAEFTQRLHFELRFQGPQFRESIEYTSGNTSIHAKLYETSFDGTTFRLGFKDLLTPASSQIHIYKPIDAAEYARKHDEPRMFNKMEFSYLFETGFIGPQTMDELGQPVKSMVLNAVDDQKTVSVSEVAGGNGNIVEVIIEQPEPWQSLETFDIETHEEYLSMNGGSRTLQMRVETERRQLAGKHRVIKLWLNSALGYAVEEKWESRKETGETMFHTKNSDFAQIGPDGVWMPKRCVVESHAYWTAPVLISSDPLYETEIRMDKCELGDFDEEQFCIWYDTPGVMVSDWRIKKGSLDDPDIYNVPSSIYDLASKSSWAKRWTVILNIVFIAGMAGWLGWRYIRSRKTRTGD